jgi:hypothetical protein
MTTNPTLSRLAMALTDKGVGIAVRIMFWDTTDAELVALYQATDGVSGNPVADLLCAEMEQREVVF